MIFNLVHIIGTLQTSYLYFIPEVFLLKGVLKICSKFTGEHPCRSVISIKMLCLSLQLH